MFIKCMKCIGWVFPCIKNGKSLESSQMLPSQSPKGLICSLGATRSNILPALLQFLGIFNFMLERVNLTPDKKE